ncbi:hypothetical protein T4D_5046 [Trichinella pseudospiralis]|uniref:Uncharacterized protein n=1 Tax=Trichinella pseudospiralis TaxID=6337 RepID=A0A0V1G8G5_TRIPS|nr:hypothetical protein T4D_5046 [Trichinella pseudospiralis]
MAIENLQKEAELKIHLQAPQLIRIRIEVVKKEPDVNCVFYVTTRQTYIVRNAKNTFANIIYTHICLNVHQPYSVLLEN